MRRLLQPLAVESFALDPENRVFRLAPEARKAFALGVVREAGFDFMPAAGQALVQAAVAGDAATCRTLLQQHGPSSTAASSRQLRSDDAALALKAFESNRSK